MGARKPKPRPAPENPTTDNMVTPDDAEEFWRYFYEWQRKLGLQGWRLTRSPLEAKNAMAEMSRWDRKQRQATVRLGLNWKSSKVDPLNLERTAVHELLHVLLADLIEFAKDPNTNADDLAGIEHAVINTLEELLVPGKEEQ